MAFTYKSPVTVDHTKVPSTQTDFKLLISLTDNRFKTVGNGGHVQNANGYDIRPYSDAALTTPLTYELESGSFNASTGTFVMWVLISSLSSSSDTTIYLAYGDSGISTDGSSTSVWTDLDYRFVYHMGSGNIVKESALGQDATQGSGASGTGKIAGGVSFDGTQISSTLFRRAVSGTDEFGTSDLTLSGWIKSNTSGNVDLFGMRDACNNAQMLTFYYDASGFAFVNINGAAGSNHLDVGGNTVINDNAWHLLHCTRVGTSVSLYVDGVLDETLTSAGTADVTSSGGMGVGGGPCTPSPDPAMVGLVDEVRWLKGTARTTNWITTEYNNQSDPSTFETLGAETSASPDVTVNVTGLLMTASINSVSVTTDSSVSIGVSGLSMTAAIGSVTVLASDVTVSVTGLSAATAIGDVVVAVPSGESVDVFVTGLSMTADTGVLLMNNVGGAATLLLAFDTGAISRDSEAAGGWFWDIYNPNVVCHYGEEGKGVHSLLMGGADGHLYQYLGDDDNGTPISMEFTTPSLDQGQPRENKLYGDIMLDCDTDGVTVTATPYVNNNLGQLTSVSVNTSSRLLVTIPLQTGPWQTARNISLNVIGQISGGLRPLYYIWEPRYTFESAPIAALSWEISPTTYGMEGFKSYGLVKITHVSSVDLDLTFTIDGIVQPTIVIPNSGGIYMQSIFRVPVMKGKIHKIRLASSDGVTDVRLDPRDTFFEVKNWGSDGPYDKLRVFGDYAIIEG